MAGIIGADNRFGCDFNNPDPEIQGNITALYDIGCVIGSILYYFVGERYDRRKILISDRLIMIVGAAIFAGLTIIAWLIVGRILTGIGAGMNSSTVPVYLTECAPANSSGALPTLQGIVTILGVVIAY
jgi:MFS family permease